MSMLMLMSAVVKSGCRPIHIHIHIHIHTSTGGLVVGDSVSGRGWTDVGCVALDVAGCG
jgi:hypothetical protein